MQANQKIFFYLTLLVFLLIVRNSFSQVVIKNKIYSQGEHQFVYDQRIISPDISSNSVKYQNTAKVLYKSNNEIVLRPGFNSGKFSTGYFKARFAFEVYLNATMECGANSGTITTEIFGGKSPFTYHWSTSESSSFITYTTSGTYYVTVTDARGISYVGSVLVNSGTRANIEWYDTVGVEINGYKVQKTANNGWQTGGAASTNKLAKLTKGGIEYRISVNDYNDNVGYKRAFGLSDTNSNANYNTINYAFFFDEDSVDIRENGTIQHSPIQYFANDIFTIVRSDDTIKYKQNGTLLRQTIVSHVREKELITDISLYDRYSYFTEIKSSFCVLPLSVEAIVTDETLTDSGSINLIISGGVTPFTIVWNNDSTPTYTEIVSSIDTIWGIDTASYVSKILDYFIQKTTDTKLLNLTAGKYSCKVYDAVGHKFESDISVSFERFWSDLSGTAIVDGKTLLKTSKEDKWNDGFATLKDPFSSNEGSILFKPSENLIGAVVGLRNIEDSQAHSYENMSACIILGENHTVDIWNGEDLIDNVSEYSPDDSFEIKTEKGDVEYYKNGSLLYTQAGLQSNNYLVDIMLLKSASSLDVIHIIPFHLYDYSAIVSGADCFQLDSLGGSVDVTFNGLFLSNIVYSWYDQNNTLITHNQDITGVNTSGIYHLNISASYFGVFPFSINKYYRIGYRANWIVTQNLSVSNQGVLTSTLTNPGLNAGSSSYNSLNPNTAGWVEYVYKPQNNTDDIIIVGVSDDQQFVATIDNIKYGFFIYRTQVGTNWLSIIFRKCNSLTPFPFLVSNSDEANYLVELTTDSLKLYRNNSLAFIPSIPLNNTSSVFIKTSLLFPNTSIKNIQSSFSCLQSLPKPYYCLSKNIDGGFYPVINNKVPFKFDGEYSIGNLTYSVTDIATGNILPSNATTINTSIRNYGDNRYELSVSGLSSGFYTLEVKNEKNVSYYLKFKY